MCTLSIIAVRSPNGGWGFRAVCNRDENRDRPPAKPPAWRPIPDDALGRKAVWPTDIQGSGTWIGANSGGLLLCLLNLNPSPPPMLPPPQSLRSRGLVIPSLIAAADAADALGALQELDLDVFAPFRLVAVDARASGVRILEARWDREELALAQPVRPPACFVSSGLGDALVLPRLDLFQSQVAPHAEADASQAQDRFHQHAWPDRPEISVLMRRDDARTVSITTVQVLGGSVAMDYAPVPAERQAHASAAEVWAPRRLSP